ncbi:MAG: BREX-1 system adenine-specific DNA-methyltransferase PglX [Oscillospiraceae bacterium]|nr:BREX-1 system adenine-specific DNA-methyltransferase PglX [Oscillospiraceae bacterium]
MNKTSLKNYAVWARNTLIESVVQRAYEYSITDSGKNHSNLTSVGDKPLSVTEQNQRKQLIYRIDEKGFNFVMEEAAYTWFNRFIALRYMEANGYLPSKVRVFTDENGAFKPDILKEALTVEIEGLDREKIITMVESQQNEALYKYLIITQCNALSHSLPEMFEQIGGWTELLFPANLLREGSVIQRMVEDIPESDWLDQVQIIGWLYQCYNSEPKNKVFADMKKNIKISKENIPAATQLFTPDWIVRYMVENSLGRLWYEGHTSFDKSEWKYYLDEAEQEESVKIELEKLGNNLKNLNPEDIKFIDPCMGSGHVLVYAFDVLMQIYTSVGYSERDAAQLIISKNLYGLDLDKRAYQLAYFAVMMRARQYDRRFLTRGIQPNISYFQDIPNVDNTFLSGSLKTFAEQFRNADIYGSLMSVQAVEGLNEAISTFNNMIGFEQNQLEHLMLLHKILSQKYDVVCTNPPYMGGSGMNAVLSDYVKKNFPDSKSDLFACFIEKCGQFAKSNGYYAMITQHAWMFLSSYENLRKKLMQKTTINMAHLGARAFDEIGGEVVQTTTFVQTGHIADYKGTYARLVDIVGENEKREMFLSGENRYTAKQENFSKIPGSPVAYWVSENIISAYNNTKIYDVSKPCKGIDTGDNNRFLRLWYEIDNRLMLYPRENPLTDSDFNKKWYPYNKGGSYRKWYGNGEYLLNYEQNGSELKNFKGSNLRNKDYYFRDGLTWSTVTSAQFSIRRFKFGYLFDNGGCCLYANDNIEYILGFLNTSLVKFFLELSPTLNFQPGDIGKMPVIIDKSQKNTIDTIVEENINISKQDWDSFETSWNFEKHPLV